VTCSDDASASILIATNSFYILTVSSSRQTDLEFAWILIAFQQLQNTTKRAASGHGSGESTGAKVDYLIGVFAASTIVRSGRMRSSMVWNDSRETSPARTVTFRTSSISFPSFSITTRSV
jgi:hypothetical protein